MTNKNHLNNQKIEETNKIIEISSTVNNITLLATFALPKKNEPNSIIAAIQYRSGFYDFQIQKLNYFNRLLNEWEGTDKNYEIIHVVKNKNFKPKNVQSHEDEFVTTPSNFSTEL